MDTSNLSEEQLKFLDSKSIGALILGPNRFFSLNNLSKEFYKSFIPVYSMFRMWPLAISNGKRIAWEKGNFSSFQNFQRKQKLIDYGAYFYLLGGFIGLIWAFISLASKVVGFEMGILSSFLLGCVGISVIIAFIIHFQALAKK